MIVFNNQNGLSISDSHNTNTDTLTSVHANGGKGAYTHSSCEKAEECVKTKFLINETIVLQGIKDACTRQQEEIQKNGFLPEYQAANPQIANLPEEWFTRYNISQLIIEHNYDSSIFIDGINGDIIIRMLILLVWHKTNKQWLIRKKVDWHAVYLVLQHMKLISATYTDFSLLINNHVLKYVNIKKRADLLSINCHNISNNRNLVARIPLANWSGYLNEHRNTKDKKDRRRLKSLTTAVNIYYFINEYISKKNLSRKTTGPQKSVAF